MTEMTHVIAPTKEGQQCMAAFGVFKNHLNEWQLRASNSYRISDPAARDYEENFLYGWKADLDAERHRIVAWRADLHRKQIARGQLIPQEDGSFLQGDLTRPATAVGAVAKVVGGGTLRGFARTTFRTKFGLTGLLLFLIGLAAVMGGAGQLGALFGVFGFLFLVAWFFMGALGLGGGGGRFGRSGGHETHAARMQMEAMRAEAERAAANEAAEAEAKAAADRRRREAIERAASRANGGDDMDWG